MTSDENGYRSSEPSEPCSHDDDLMASEQGVAYIKNMNIQERTRTFNLLSSSLTTFSCAGI